jgi:hypothetical protein
MLGKLGFTGSVQNVCAQLMDINFLPLCFLNNYVQFCTNETLLLLLITHTQTNTHTHTHTHTSVFTLPHHAASYC